MRAAVLKVRKILYSPQPMAVRISKAAPKSCVVMMLLKLQHACISAGPQRDWILFDWSSSQHMALMLRST